MESQEAPPPVPWEGGQSSQTDAGRTQKEETAVAGTGAVAGAVAVAVAEAVEVAVTVAVELTVSLGMGGILAGPAEAKTHKALHFADRIRQLAASQPTTTDMVSKSVAHAHSYDVRLVPCPVLGLVGWPLSDSVEDVAYFLMHGGSLPSEAERCASLVHLVAWACEEKLKV